MRPWKVSHHRITDDDGILVKIIGMLADIIAENQDGKGVPTKRA